LDGNERKKRSGGEDKGGGKYRETRRELLGISREGHLYLARRDRCSTIIDLRDGSIERDREGEGESEREKKEGKVLTRSSRARPDSVEHVDWCARSRDRAYLF